jgi:succinoglycan biosynthesis protein ExoM
MSGRSTIDGAHATDGQSASGSPPDVAGDGPRIDVCICTWNRPDGLYRLLVALHEQESAPPFRVLVADNHASPVEAATVADFAARTGMDLHYLHAPADNIAIARNAALDAARAPLLAFVDDDEIPAPDWLATLSRVQQETGADALVGSVQPVYPADAPAWLVDGDFHAKWPGVDASGRCRDASTANALVVRARIRGLHFDQRFGRSGGEDTLWFAQLRERGVEARPCVAAAVVEAIDRQRLSLQWLCRRAFGSGQTHARVSRLLGRSSLRLGCLAAAKSMVCIAMSMCTVVRPVAWRRWLIRASLHAGVVHAACGGDVLTFYGAPPPDPASR